MPVRESWRTNRKTRLTVEQHGSGGETTVVLGGEIDLSVAAALRESLFEAADAARHLHVDLSKVTFLDSSGIAQLIAARKRVHGSGGSFSVTCASGLPRTTLEIVGLIEYLGVTEPET